MLVRHIGGEDMRANKGKIKLAMANACMNPQDLAKAAQMPPQTVNRIIQERNVRPATLGRVARALGVSTEDILEEV